MGLFKKDKRTKDINPQKMIEEEKGVKVNKNGTIEFSPVYLSRFNEQAVRLFLKDYCVRRYCSKYTFYNIPCKGIESYDIMLMRYYYDIIGFQKELSTILPVLKKGDLSYIGKSLKGGLVPFGGCYSEPKKLKPIMNKTYDIIYDGYKDIYSSEDLEKAIIPLKFNSYSISNSIITRNVLDDVIINRMVETFKRLDVNLVVSSPKILIGIKGGDTDALNKTLEKVFSSDSPFAFFRTDSDFSVNTIMDKNNMQIEELFSCIKEYDNMLSMSTGIPSESYGIFKKERMITGELQPTQTQMEILMKQEDSEIQNWVDSVNKCLGNNDFYFVNNIINSVNVNDDYYTNNEENEQNEEIETKEGDLNES